ncbi:MAG: ABC transporter ATP-binding protein [Pseudomonadota bacterium]
MSATDAVVHLQSITKRFGRTVAVDALDLAIGRGEFVTFLGPSGCGKSTTLRMLGGFETPDEGRILLDGADVTRQPPNRRNVNMVFQDYALFPHMSVRKNVAFGLELKGLSRSAIDAKVVELLAFLQLEALADRQPDQLSGGQRQRVALARALAPDPKLLLLDEPLGALDAKLRGQLQVELKDIQRRTGKTFLFVTHDQDEALTMSDRIVVMNEGRVEQDGTPEDLYMRPQTRFVAEFIGETNLITGTVQHAEGGVLSLDWGGRSIKGITAGPAPAAGAAMTGSLRLEHVSVHAADPGVESLPARLTSRIFKGSRTLVDVTVEGGEQATLSAYLPAETAIEEGAAVWVTWEPQRLFLFDH